jgi:asparagine synthase (glutamine-hydrolysing)
MCGISGLLRFDGHPAERETLERMIRIQSHRGPDDQGVYLDGPLGLGHNRLTIIDLSPLGHQPMSNEDGTIWITFNGELYNYRELRPELEALGHVFRSHSDTEALIHAYESWGLACLERFNGMFALALWEAPRRRLTLIRDRYGVKPLHYHLTDKRLIFASEIKTLLAAGVTPRLMRDQVHEYLMYNWLVGETTLFEGVKTVLPGHIMTVTLEDERPRIVQEPYYSVFDQMEKEHYRRLSVMRPEALCDELDGLLQESVRLRLVSDAPVGSLCSGGVDSSLITALARRASDEVQVYNVNVSDAPDARLSEGRHAERAARHLGVSMNRFDLDRKTFLEMFARTLYHNDMPLTHPNAVPMYAISRMAAGHGVKVLLSGEGADELFGGYTWRYARFYTYLQRKKIARFVPDRLKFFFGGSFLLDDDILMYGYRTSLGNVVNTLDFLSGRFERSRLRDRGRNAYSFVSEKEERETLAFLAADMREYLEHLLHRQDRSIMQASVECREPMLDPRLVRFALNLPLAFKWRRREGKWLLKRLACRYLPRDLIFRPKIGFGIPIQKYLFFPDGEIFRDGFWASHFDLPWSRLEPVFKWSRDPLLYYSFLNFEIWGRLFLNGESPDAITDRFLRL